MKNKQLIASIFALAIVCFLNIGVHAQQKTFSSNKLRISVIASADMEIVLDDANQFMIQNNSAGISFQRETLIDSNKETRNKYLSDMVANLSQSMMLDLDATTVRKSSVKVENTEETLTYYHDINSGLEIVFAIIPNTKNEKEILFVYAIYEKGYEQIVNNIIKSSQINENTANK